MVRAFLLAELDSPRWGPLIHKLLRTHIGVVTHASGDDPVQSLVRRMVLTAYRGYGIDTYLFAGFPDEVAWSRCAATVQELGGFRYANCEPWAPLAGGARLVRDGAAHVEVGPSDVAAAVGAIENEIRGSRTYPPLIAVGVARNGVHVLVEGHTRATAYIRALGPSDEIELVVGYSAGMSSWRFWVGRRGVLGSRCIRASARSRRRGSAGLRERPRRPRLRLLSAT
jgi:hypothetical protein